MIFDNNEKNLAAIPSTYPTDFELQKQNLKIFKTNYGHSIFNNFIRQKKGKFGWKQHIKVHLNNCKGI